MVGGKVWDFDLLDWLKLNSLNSNLKWGWGGAMACFICARLSTSLV